MAERYPRGNKNRIRTRAGAVVLASLALAGTASASQVGEPSRGGAPIVVSDQLGQYNQFPAPDRVEIAQPTTVSFAEATRKLRSAKRDFKSVVGRAAPFKLTRYSARALGYTRDRQIVPDRLEALKKDGSGKVMDLTYIVHPKANDEDKVYVRGIKITKLAPDAETHKNKAVREENLFRSRVVEVSSMQFRPDGTIICSRKIGRDEPYTVRIDLNERHNPNRASVALQQAAEVNRLAQELEPFARAQESFADITNGVVAENK